MAHAAELLENMVPVSVFSQGKASEVFKVVEGDHPVTVLRNNKPIGVIVSVEDYARMSEAEEEYYLLTRSQEQATGHDEPHR